MAPRRSATTSPPILNSPRGFVLVFLLAFLPVIMSAMIAYLLLNTVVQSWMQAKQFCRTELLRTQGSVSENLTELLSLNPSVESLRGQIQVTKLEIATALESGQLEALPLLRQTLLSLEHQEQVIGFKQKTIVTAANLKMLAGTLKVDRGLRQQFALSEPKLNRFAIFHLMSVQSPITRLAVRSDAPDGAAAIYEPVRDFNTKQRLQVFWKLNLAIGFTQWTRNWFHFSGSKDDFCAATLKQKGAAWESTLNEDKY